MRTRSALHKECGKNAIGTENIFQHGERMIVFKIFKNFKGQLLRFC